MCRETLHQLLDKPQIQIAMYRYILLTTPDQIKSLKQMALFSIVSVINCSEYNMAVSGRED